MIVCGVDECAEAARAALVASDLAVRLDVPLLLVHVAPPPWVPEGALGDRVEQIQEEAAFDRAGYLATVLDPIEVNPAASVVRVVEFGQPADVVRSVATGPARRTSSSELEARVLPGTSSLPAPAGRSPVMLRAR